MLRKIRNLIDNWNKTIFFINPRTRQSVNSTDFAFWGPSDPKIKMKDKILNYIGPL